MVSQLDRPELVRCVTCHAVYEQTIASAQSEDEGACPRCGEVAWLACWIPVEEAAAPLPA
jgi:phage FluMu protein Com